ncbi:3-deoxy-7-phosphoheptulonate synthase class II [Nocardioides sp. cx-173]|uniref:class II 3-deoxy-7-phosphoheptulonate synthase n=1 Tax=Nocardioides sp. cx-169 TaxID=2899080 RepID=UPI001E492731|nr:MULTISPECIES: 3-deoxy-7-phosphoheptulonate synthase class II [unclassified Nocardioides]MCD4526293.1 3-deoxy-7-phosphoheptulonate synthase class II [Nocardioides sp. cx-173]MCD4534713.1 3-deoxy-7-phosphoheptulonate synthase class II [Nocardioides sp. cx-169]UGB43469.1 3-deoxy-7-phosphoheptulonate synthase class II [Nocardioides sp. cx-173]
MSSDIPDLAALHALGPAQQPTYADRDAVDAAVARLRTAPPLVFAGECDDLKAKLAAVTRGEAFLLQGGDCAETFSGVTADNVRNKLRVLLQMAVVLTYAASVPVVKLGRLAGQYAKPRSSDLETRGDVTLPAYRGDAVNGYDFTAESRVHDPQRLVDVYNASASTLNLVRAFVTGGYADLRQVHTWNTDFVRDSVVGQQYEKLAHEIDRAMSFMKAIGADPDEFHRVDFHSSHEALVLEYEHAMTRIDSRTQLPYDVSAHFLWIGERTRQLDNAHVELLRHIQNPIGVKLGPSTTPDDALALAARLNPDNEAGRLTFITRFGAGKIRDGLPQLVEKVTAEGVNVAWVCDPMHGNTFEASSGYKTRAFGDVIDEVQGFFDVHHGLGTWPGGIHVELTGDDVTECVGGGEALLEADLGGRYESVCDPRLNRVQSLELAFLVAEMLRRA